MKAAYWTCTCVSLAVASPSHAFVEISFQDGNPWDVFVITNDGCPVAEAALRIDLTTSIAGVLIDTTYGGPGTQDPLPAELSRGDAMLAPVADGDQHLTVAIGLLAPDHNIQLQMDVDDTSTTSPGLRISVAKSEIAGATATLTFADEASTGTFDVTGVATLPLPSTIPDCNLLS